MVSFGGEVKPSVPWHKIYGMLKNPFSMKEILHRQNSVAISYQVSPALLLGSLLVIARELWWMNQE
jgi:hypothetical protein